MPGSHIVGQSPGQVNLSDRALSELATETLENRVDALLLLSKAKFNCEDSLVGCLCHDSEEHPQLQTVCRDLFKPQAVGR